ncbi:O-antigen ligase family protein [Engelhardtia mirabilis]|uniref:O-Antigen ligase n=1 Tax=Engelhardtia mirabilis TaxID=2528011 RepID=A0A518BJ20_9BACT|nr:O-Antigen ligase [Planctomycetes bacterium Pla133]QDV01294.1 O-Antigen ligase [Planctomycetes bacterium Pla86]
MSQPSRIGRAATDVVAIAIGLVAASYGLYAVETLILAGTFPGAASWTDRVPVVSRSSLALLLIAAAWRRPGWTSVAGAVVAWALGTSAVCELPSFATNFDLGDTPYLWPWMLAIGTLLGLATLGFAGPKDAGARLAVLAVFGATANGKLFSRHDEAVFALLAACVLLLVLELARTPLRPLGRGGRVVLGVGLSFTLWVLVAALLGDSVGQGLRVFARVAAGGALALCLGLLLDSSGRRAVAVALLAGVGASLTLLAVGYTETAQVTGWTALLDSRLRLFDMHPNGIGPLFAGGATLGLGFALAGGSSRAVRWGSVALALCSVAALIQTDSRASLLGLGAGLATFALAFTSRAPRDGRPWYAGAVLLIAAGAGFWASPAADGLRVRLDGMAGGLSALGQRYHFWRMALASLRESPWFGVGPNQYHVHAKYALPSFYDGTTQTLHTHNLPLGIAEGAGWPALLLYGALLLCTIEAARRTLRAAETRADRALPAGVLASLMALHASNLLDLGQSQGTFVPTLGWIALGWFAAAAVREHRVAPAPVAGVLAVALVGLVFAVAQPLAGAALRERSIALHDRGRPDESLAVQERALAIDPGDTGGLPAVARMAARMGRREVALALRERRVESAPGNASAHLALAREQLAQLRLPAARRSLAKARELDPLGEQRADFEVLEATMDLAEGDDAAALEALIRACLVHGTPWERLPTVKLSPDEQGLPRLAFAGADGRPAIPLEVVLDEVARRAIERVDSDPVGARRELIDAVHGFRAEGRPDRGIEWMRVYSERLGVDRMASMLVVELDSLLSAGRSQEALDLAVHTADAAHKALLFRQALALRALGRDAEALEVAEQAHAAREGNDLFFDAGTYRPLALLRCELLGEAGRWTDAAAALRLALQDTQKPDDRLAAATDFWQRILDAEPSREALLDAIEVLGLTLGAKLEAPDRTGAMDARARRALRAWGGEPADLLRAVRGRLAGRGLAAEELLDAFGRLTAG